MRELDQAQADFLMRINTPEYREEARKNEEAHLAAMAAAQAERERKWALQQATWEERCRARAEVIRPLKEALQAAGIKLHFSSHDEVWGDYQIGNGPVVEFDADSFGTFEED